MVPLKGRERDSDIYIYIYVYMYTHINREVLLGSIGICRDMMGCRGFSI